MEGKSVPVLAIIRAKAGCEHRVKAALEGLVEPTRCEEGCLRYDLHRDAGDPCLFVFFEEWACGEDLDRHLASEHVVETGEALGEDLDGAVEIRRLEGIC